MGQYKKNSLKKISSIVGSIALSSILLSGTCVTAFAANNMPINNASEEKKGIFYTDYSTPDALMKAAKELAEEISEEGMVLLKNDDNALPLSGGAKVSVFGKSSVNPAYGGGGSGALSGVTPVSLYEGLQNAGFKTNGVLEAFYKNNNLSGNGRSDKTYVNETPVDKYTEMITTSYKAYNDAAIVVLTRTGAEGSDLPRTGNANDEGARYLSVTQDEIDLINHANENFEKVIVLVNSSNTIELGAIKDKVDSILWVGNPGERGFNAVGRILNGEVNPSGKLSDVYVSDLTMDPTWANFGDNSQNTGVGYVSKNNNGTYAWNTNKYNALHATGETVPAGTIIQVNGADKDISGMPVYAKGGTYTEYEEGIYVGYRYYETRAYEMGEAGAAWYEDLVDYTFGAGLSYTNFAWSWKGEAPELTLAKDGTVEFEVVVTNEGKVAGKDVVQMYYSAPYTANGIEKSVVNLGAYAKTDLLQPGESQTLTLSMKVQDMSSFDWNDANGNGFRGYELEAGDYNFYIGKDAHCWNDATALKVTATVAEDAADGNFESAATNGKNGYTYTKDSNTGNDIEVLFSNDDIYNTNLKQDENKLVRSTFATAPVDENIIPEKTLEDFALEDAGWELISSTSHLFAIEDDAGDHYAYEGEEHAPWYVETAPANWKQYAGSEEDRPAPTYTFADAAGWSYDDERWETLLNELTWQELVNVVYISGFTNAKVDYIGKAQAIDDDGPMQVKLDQSPLAGTNDDFTGTGWPCAVLVATTWNVELAEEQGIMIGNECLYLGISGWFAPAMNLHRNQYGGRIFEYYSCDPVQGGYIAAAVTRGVQSKGVYAYLKHFCLNNQDTGRGSISIVVNEQAMRELYMYTFELAVELGGAHGLMTYYSFVGGVSIMSNYAILTDYVRNQWGFEGVINHDYGPEAYNSAICSPALTRRVGNGVGGSDNTRTGRYYDQAYYDAETNMVYYCLDGTGKVVASAEEGNGVASPTHWWAMRESAKQLLWTTANSNNQLNKLDLAQFAGKTIEAKQGTALNASVGVNLETFGTANVSYELHSGELPAGITLNTTTGAISGTTKEIGEFEFEVRMRADFWIKKTETYKLVVDSVLSIDATEAEVGEEFYAVIEGLDAAAYDSIAYTAEGLPAGVTVDAETGEIIGTPSAPGAYNVVITAKASKTTSNGWWGSTTTVSEFSLPVTITVTGEEVVTKDIVSVEPIEDGYKITFTDGSSIEIMNGEDGKDGVDGAPGKDGVDGAPGKDGVDGAPGKDGEDGAKGDKGDKGDTGAAGKDGADGKDALAALGCSGSIAGIASLAALVAVGGAMIIRRKED